MSPQSISSSIFSSDALEFIDLLARHRVRYLIVGGEAVIFHGYPRLTGDIDFFYDCTAANASRLFSALDEFWHGDIPGLTSMPELLEPGVIIQFGRPPNRIDLHNRIDGLTFASAWRSRIEVQLQTPKGAILAIYIGKNALLRNKRASGRPKDLDDVEHLPAQRTDRASGSKTG